MTAVYAEARAGYDRPMPSTVKAAARARVDESRDGLIDLSHRIHAHPELKFEEERSSTWVAEALTDAGFTVETGVCDLPTACWARLGSGPLRIAICAEYDCLPGIGHACGHNMIAAMAVGAAVGLAEVADDIGIQITVLGTPAEEGGGGKILMLERGAFEGVHAAMMVHPAPIDVVEPSIIAAAQFKVRYTGKEAHASAFPELGINAGDALVVAQTAIGLLRQQMRPHDRVHGIVTRGGDAPNVIPAHTEAHYIVRALQLAELPTIQERVLRCFEAGATATGAAMEVEQLHKPYAQMRHDPEMATIYKRNAEAVGRSFPDLGDAGLRPSASTDMGNVSLAIPSIHPFIGIDSLPAVNHQPEFAAHCVSAVADKAVIDGATAMAWTAIDIAADEALSQRLAHARTTDT
jgi:amidohydrolase